MVPPRLDILMFMAATGAIMHCYSDARGKHRDVFRSKYLNVLDFILGSKGMLNIQKLAYKQRAHHIACCVSSKIFLPGIDNGCP